MLNSTNKLRLFKLGMRLKRAAGQLVEQRQRFNRGAQAVGLREQALGNWLREWSRKAAGQARIQGFDRARFLSAKVWRIRELHAASAGRDGCSNKAVEPGFSESKLEEETGIHKKRASRKGPEGAQLDRG